MPFFLTFKVSNLLIGVRFLLTFFADSDLCAGIAAAFHCNRCASGSRFFEMVSCNYYSGSLGLASANSDFEQTALNS